MKNPVHVRVDQNHMATTFEFRVSCDPGEAARAQGALVRAQERMATLERELSEFLSESPVFQLNHAEPGVPVRLTRAGIELLLLSERIERETQGCFNPLAKSGKLSKFPALGWDAVERLAWRNDDQAHLGFGAIGKGYALDEARRMIEEAGFRDYLLSAGGSSLVLSGFAGPGVPWSWGWSWKKDAAQNNLGIALRHPSGDRIAIGVSGTHEKGRHIVGTGGPAGEPENDRPEQALSALVAAQSAAEADGLSTALFVAGWDRGLKLLNQRLLPPAIAVIEPDQSPRWNGYFQRLWGEIGTAAIALAFAFAFLMAGLAPIRAQADETLDLGSLGLNSFTPYVFERNPFWALLPALAIALVLLHLKKTRRIAMTTAQKPAVSSSQESAAPIVKPSTRPLKTLVALFLLWTTVEAQAVTVEPMGKALLAILGTPKVSVSKQKVGGKDVTAYLAKDAAGKAAKVAFVESGVYAPNCTHTWAIGIDPRSGAVTQVRVIEMSCPHAFPCKSASFLDQYKGKGPADVAKLDGQVTTVAKATGTSKLTTDAVKHAIVSFSQFRGKI